MPEWFKMDKKNCTKWIKGFKEVQKECTAFNLYLRKLDFVLSYAPMHKFCACFILFPEYIHNEHKFKANLILENFSNMVLKLSKMGTKPL